MRNLSSHSTFPVSKTRSGNDTLTVLRRSRFCRQLALLSVNAVLLTLVSGCGAPPAETSSPVAGTRQAIPTAPTEEVATEVPSKLAREEFVVQPATEDRRFGSAPEPSLAVEPSLAAETTSDSWPTPIPTSKHASKRGAPRPTGTMRRTRSMTQPAAPQSPDAHSNSPRPQQTVDVSPENKQPANVEVFYATDRHRIASVSKGDLWNVFSWAFQLGLVTLIAGILGSLYQRQGIKLIAASTGIACLVLSYGGWIEWQQRTRLKHDGDVWYTHDLKIVSDTSHSLNTSADSSEALDYGICQVTIPPNHQTGLVEAPSITRFELTEDPEKHVVLKKITRSDSSEFFSQLNHRLDSGSDEALIFIHGYNVSFNNAVKRTAQISHDVKFQGTPICYSWPSRGGLEDYTRDMANADWSVVHLQDFLASLFEKSRAGKIHLIAHSMGNRVLMQALDRLALQSQTETRFGQIVLAAPDVSANDFRQRYSTVIRQMSDNVTLYASSRDRALMVSAGVHGHDRAGLAGDDIVVVEGIDTIDVSHVDTSLIGHSYYGDNPELIDDLKAIILRAKPTSSRSWLQRIDTAANRFYWKFR